MLSQDLDNLKGWAGSGKAGSGKLGRVWKAGRGLGRRLFPEITCQHLLSYYTFPILILLQRINCVKFNEESSLILTGV